MMIHCECENEYSIEPHGQALVLYYGRCVHRHGFNLVYLTEPAKNFNPEEIEKLLNLGSKYQKILESDHENP